MWIDYRNNFEDLSFADDIMMPRVFSDSDQVSSGERIKTDSNFGNNISKVSIPGDGKMGLISGAFRHPNIATRQLNKLAYTLVKGAIIDLGSDESGNRFTTADVQFVGRVLTVAAFLEMPTTIGNARDNLNPIPAWKFSKQVGDFDHNDDGEGNTIFNGLINGNFDDADSCNIFLDKLEQGLLLQAVSPRRYLIRKENKDFTNTGLAAKIILALNEVK